MENKTLTVFTPAFNRGYCIENCYKSLCRQTCKDFVWLVVDDGSSDNTAELVRSWQGADNGFEIRYVYKENGGMHTAHNTAYENIDTPLNVCIDSDDYMPDDAVEKIVSFWKENGSDEYAGIMALDILENGKVIGTELPTDRKSMHIYEFYAKGSGDKKFIYRTDVINSYPPYPVFEGEKYVSLAYKYRLCDEDYELLVMNEPVCIVEYRMDGSSTNMFRQYLKNPKGFCFNRKQQMIYEHSRKNVFMACVHYVAESVICKNIHFLKESPRKLCTLAALPFGIALYFYIRLKSRGYMKVEGIG